MTIEPGEGEWISGDHWRVCSECRHIHPCTMLAAPGDQPGFPEGEWMCWFCICGEYNDDPGWPRPDVFPDPRPASERAHPCCRHCTHTRARPPWLHEGHPLPCLRCEQHAAMVKLFGQDLADTFEHALEKP
jgi:hypothetical protein